MSVPRTPASGIAIICRDCHYSYSSFCGCLLFPHITFQESELTIYTTSYYLHHLINTLSLLLPSLRTNWLTALHIFHGVSAAIQVSSTLKKNIFLHQIFINACTHSLSTFCVIRCLMKMAVQAWTQLITVIASLRNQLQRLCGGQHTLRTSKNDLWPFIPLGGARRSLECKRDEIKSRDSKTVC